MQAHQLYDEMIALMIMVAALMVARPVLSWLLMKIYNVFIGTNHY